MEFSNSLFLETYKKIGRPCEKIAESPSLYPDSPVEIYISSEFGNSAEEVIATLAVLPLCVKSTRNYQITENIREHFGRMATNYRLEGKWSIVQEILERTTNLSVYQVWSIILRNLSPQDWFGNFVPLMTKAIRSLRYRCIYSSVVSDTRKVNKPQRKRGYNDKGTQRPSHKWLPKFLEVEVKEIQKVQVKVPRPFAWFKYCEK